MPIPETIVVRELADAAELALFGGAPDGHTIRIDGITRMVLRNLVAFAYRNGQAEATLRLSTPSMN